MSQHASDLAQQAGHHEKAALFATRLALWQAFFGNASAARHTASAALEQAPNREVQFGAAFALALSDDSARSQALTDELQRSYPEDTSVRFTYLPALRSLLALERHDPSAALVQLETAAPYEISSPRSAINAFLGALYPVFVRRQAYLAAHQGAEAATTEFPTILDRPGITIGDPISALAHLGLARAYAVEAADAKLTSDAQQSFRAKARTAYNDFLTLWKDADSGIPILKQAKVEWAKLQ
jgi:hypothetical protein